MHLFSFYTVLAFPYSSFLNATSTHHLAGQDTALAIILVWSYKQGEVQLLNSHRSAHCFLFICQSVCLFVCLYAKLIRSFWSDDQKK